MSTRNVLSATYLPDDYEECSECGFDHDYEYPHAVQHHERLSDYSEDDISRAEVETLKDILQRNS